MDHTAITSVPIQCHTHDCIYILGKSSGIAKKSIKISLRSHCIDSFLRTVLSLAVKAMTLTLMTFSLLNPYLTSTNKLKHNNALIIGIPQV
jgi:hypothetical protein